MHTPEEKKKNKKTTLGVGGNGVRTNT